MSPTSDYTVHVVRSDKPKIEQAFFVRIVAKNGETMFTSEMYKDRIYAVSVAEDFAAMLDGNLVDAT